MNSIELIIILLHCLINIVIQANSSSVLSLLSLDTPYTRPEWQVASKYLHKVNDEQCINENDKTMIDKTDGIPVNIGYYNDTSFNSKWKWKGRSLLSKGKIAIVLLAGGLGTRVGSNAPKGMLNINLPSGRSLFQMHADMIIAQQDAAGVELPLYIMTSPMLYRNVYNVFELHQYFGLNRSKVHFFNQTLLPCFDFDGKIAMQTPTTVATSPGGHGDLLYSLQHSGMLKKMESTNVDWVFTFNVDNPLANVPDPTFLGYCATMNTSRCFKVVERMRLNEALNIFEYETSDQTARYFSYHHLNNKNKVTNEHVEVPVVWGDMMHILMKLSFIKQFATNDPTNSLKWHKVPARIRKQKGTPLVVNGYKFEQFLPDIFENVNHLSDKSASLFVANRLKEFSPIKNAWGKKFDSPDQAKQNILKYHRSVLIQNGVEISLDKNIEICPSLLVASDRRTAILKSIENNEHFDSDDTRNNIYLCHKTNNGRSSKKDKDGIEYFSYNKNALSPLELIVKKRDKNIFTRDDIFNLVMGYTHGKIPDFQMSAILMAIQLNGLTESETNDFTLAMLASGDVANLDAIPGFKADKHSTGGVGDGISLVLAPLLAACGISVPMMSGRGLGHTGGTLDKLESIPGLKTKFLPEEFVSILNQTNVVIASATENIAPADKKIYALRDVTGTVPSQGLIVGSIMSKKLAAGSDSLILDVKYGNGAFMKTKAEAISLAKKMISAGIAAGKITQAFITRMDQPLGRAIGNWLEIKQTKQILRNDIDESDIDDFLQVTLMLCSQSLINAGKVETIDQGIKMAREKLSDGSALGKFMEMIEAQGGDISIFAHEDKQPVCTYVKTISSVKSGYISKIDALTFGLMSVKLGAGRENLDDKIDYCAGMVLNKKIGEHVTAGELLFTIYTNKDIGFVEQNIIPKLVNAITVDDSSSTSLQKNNPEHFLHLKKRNVVDSFIDENGIVKENNLKRYY